MSISTEIISATSKVGVSIVKGKERTFSKYTPLGMVLYTRKLDAQIQGILSALDAKDEEIKLLKADIEKIKETVKV